MFRDRQEAGEKLTLKLKKIINPTGGSEQNFVVVALLRGGIVLGKKISDYFKIPLLPLSVKKIGAPLNPELAIGAVTSDRTYYLDEDLIKYLNIGKDYMENSLEVKWREAQTLQKKFPTSPHSASSGLRGASKDKISLKDKRVIIVDDGIATGTTAICTSIYAKKEKAQEIILAAPVIGKDTFKNIKKYFDRVVSLKIVDNLTSVSQFYKNFSQITDEEMFNFLL